MSAKQAESRLRKEIADAEESGCLLGGYDFRRVNGAHIHTDIQALLSELDSLRAELERERAAKEHFIAERDMLKVKVAATEELRKEDRANNARTLGRIEAVSAAFSAQPKEIVTCVLPKDARDILGVFEAERDAARRNLAATEAKLSALTEALEFYGDVATHTAVPCGISRADR